MSSSTDQHQDQNQSQTPSTAASNCTPEVIDAVEKQEPEQAASSSVKGYASDEIEFRTPTSRHHRIPRSRSCPPAPKKPKPKSMAHKRKLMFEDAAREEVDAFFDTTTTSSNPSKRRSFGDRSGAERVVKTTAYASSNVDEDSASGDGGL